MKSTLLLGCLTAFALLGATLASAGTDAPRGLEKRGELPLGLQEGAPPGEQASEAQGIIRDETAEVPNTGGVAAGDETGVDARLDPDGSTDTEQQATTPENDPAAPDESAVPPRPPTGAPPSANR